MSGNGLLILTSFCGLMPAMAFSVAMPRRAAFLPEEPVTSTRTYKLGEKDSYRFSITNLDSGSLKALLVEEVTKVYPNGDADILETVSKLETTGQLTMPQPAPRTIKFSPFLIATGGIPQDPITLAAFSAIIPNAEKLSSKQFITFERSLPGMGNVDVTATAKIVENNGSLAAFAVEGKLLNAFGAGADNVSQIGGSLVWDIKSHRYNRGSFYVKGKSAASDKPLEINFSFERVAEPPPKSS